MLRRFFLHFRKVQNEKRFDNPNAFNNWMQEEYYACLRKGGIRKYLSR